MGPGCSPVQLATLSVWGPRHPLSASRGLVLQRRSCTNPRNATRVSKSSI